MVPESGVKSSVGASETGQCWTPESHQGLLQRLLLSLYNIFTRSQKRAQPEDPERACAPGGGAEVRGEGHSSLSAPPHPRTPQHPQQPHPGDGSRSLSQGRGKRQTHSNPSESRKFQVALRGAVLRQQRADVNRNFPELSRGPEEGLGRQEGERGRQARGIWNSATPQQSELCCGMRSGSWD